MYETDHNISGLVNHPLVFCNTFQSWSARSWTPSNLSRILDNKKVSCKIAPVSTKSLWEAECTHEEITVSDFVDWLEGNPLEGNVLRKYDKDKFSCYIDYKYMKDVFKEKPEYLKAVRWDDLGLFGRDGEDSTLWIGSKGCYTNLHYDTYGFNLVAQIHGRKRWTLFPPSDSKYLYPTRIPYEESSVYSQVDLKEPDILHHELIKLSSPIVVELSAGQVLYVPRHWWHFVESLETSVSINTWINVNEDMESSLEEAVTRTLMSILLSTPCSLPTSGQTNNWLNPGESIWDNKENMAVLNQVFQAFKKKDGDRTCLNTSVHKLGNEESSTCCARGHDLQNQDKHLENVDSNLGIQDLNSDNSSFDRMDSKTFNCKRHCHEDSISDFDTKDSTQTQAQCKDNLVIFFNHFQGKPVYKLKKFEILNQRNHVCKKKMSTSESEEFEASHCKKQRLDSKVMLKNQSTCTSGSVSHDGATSGRGSFHGDSSQDKTLQVEMFSVPSVTYAEYKEYMHEHKSGCCDSGTHWNNQTLCDVSGLDTETTMSYDKTVTEHCRTIEKYDAHKSTQECDEHKRTQEYDAHKPTQECDEHKCTQEYDAHKRTQEDDAHKRTQECDAHKRTQEYDAHKRKQEYDAHKRTQEYDAHKRTQEEDESIANTEHCKTNNFTVNSSELLQGQSQDCSTYHPDKTINFKDLSVAVTHPDVIKSIIKVLKQNH